MLGQNVMYCVEVKFQKNLKYKAESNKIKF